MRRTIEIYCNYGVLGKEKRNVYTYGQQSSTAVCSDKITVEIPDGWEPYETETGETFLQAPWGYQYEINEVLEGKEKPYFYAIDKEGKGHRSELKIV